MRAPAFKNQCYLMSTNYCGSESESEIHYREFTPDGKQIDLAAQDEALVVATLDRQVMAESRASNTYFKDRRPGLYRGLRTDI